LIQVLRWPRLHDRVWKLHPDAQTVAMPQNFLRFERRFMMPDVVITQNNRIEEAIEEALAAIELSSLVRAKRVAVKPNETWASEMDKTGVTQSDTLRAVLRAIKPFHPAKLVVTGGAGAAETDDVFRIAGLMDVVKEEHAEFFDHNRPPFKEVELTYGDDPEAMGPQKSVMVNPRVLEYDTLISLAQLKLHATATVTLSLKKHCDVVSGGRLLRLSALQTGAQASFLRRHAFVHRGDGEAISNSLGDYRGPSRDDRYRPAWRLRLRIGNCDR
jgi:hypothetical protein